MLWVVGIVVAGAIVVGLLSLADLMDMPMGRD